MSIYSLIEDAIDEKEGIDLDSFIDSKIEEQAENRSSFPEPDRNEVDDEPDDNPEKTLKDIEKEVTESFLGFADAILNEDKEAAAEKMVDNVEKRSHNPLTQGERERMKAKFMKYMK